MILNAWHFHSIAEFSVYGGKVKFRGSVAHTLMRRYVLRGKSVVIREMHISDYSQVIGLWSTTEAMLLRDADSKENIGKYLKRNPNLSFVALDGDKIIGAILVGTDGRRGYVQHLAVDSTFRGKGVGAKLISSAVEALSKIGIAKTHLFVANENINAQSFYEKLGWFPRDEVRMFSFNSSNSDKV